MAVAYLAHPVGERLSPDDAVRYGDNMASVHEWVAFLVEVIPDLDLELSWIPMHVALPSSVYGGRRLTSAHALLSLCQVLLLVGGWVSPHMVDLSRVARAADLPVVDLTDLGERPPWARRHEVRRRIERRLDELGL